MIYCYSEVRVFNLHAVEFGKNALSRRKYWHEDVPANDFTTHDIYFIFRRHLTVRISYLPYYYIYYLLRLPTIC